jgi:peptide subunit release factor RF-3
MKLKNVRSGRQVSVQAPVFFLARERNLAEEVRPVERFVVGSPRRLIEATERR